MSGTPGEVKDDLREVRESRQNTFLLANAKPVARRDTSLTKWAHGFCGSRRPRPDTFQTRRALSSRHRCRFQMLRKYPFYSPPCHGPRLASHHHRAVRDDKIDGPIKC